MDDVGNHRQVRVGDDKLLPAVPRRHGNAAALRGMVYAFRMMSLE